MDFSEIGRLQEFQFLSQQTGAPIKDGDTVFVRILSTQGDGTVQASMRGKIFTAKTEFTSEPGSTFNARVHISGDGKITLERLPFHADSTNHQAGSLLSMLLAEGLPADDVMVRILQFVQQTGLRADKSIMMKARRISQRFPGKEKQAAEIAALLLEKGIDAPDEKIQEILNLMENGDFGHSSGWEQNPRGDEDEKEHGSRGKDGENFLDILFCEKIPDKTGLLTLMNHVSTGRMHWIILPYRWDSPNGLGSGIIRILIDTEARSTEKVEINCKINSTNYFFVLYCNKSKEKEVRFFTLPPLLPSAAKAEELRLGGFLSSGMSSEPVTVTYSDSACSDGLCTVREMPVTIEENV